mgnify:FL=1
MTFNKKTWKDRVAEFINRRLLTKEDGSTDLVTVARSEGTISVEGDAFNAETMNDLEDRVEAAFNELNTNLSSIVIIKSVKIYAATSIAAGQGADIYFSVPTVKNYKCILGIGGTCSNSFAIPVRASDVPKSDGTLRLHYKNISSGTITVNDLYCNMIFVRY